MVASMTEKVEEERNFRNRQYEIKIAEIRDLDAKLNDILDTETNVPLCFTKVRKDSENRLLRLIDEKSMMVRNELNKETRARSAAIDQLAKGLEVDIPKLHETLKEEARERQAIDQGIKNKANEEITRISGLIAA